MHTFTRWQQMTVALAAVVMLSIVPTVIAAQSAVTVEIGGNDELGEFLVAGNGMTLYIFTPDEPGVSNCNGGCAAAWPPLTVADGVTPIAGPGVNGELSLITRDDGSQQVALDGAALYFWRNDVVPGDATGQDVNDVWFVIDSDGAIVQTPVSSVEVGGNDTLGEFLVGGNGMTLYIFTPDEPGVSNCNGGCAAAWPPLMLADGETLSAGAGVNGELSLITRDDGSQQVALNGAALYFWKNDVVPGDATGQDVNDVWFVIDRDGAIVQTPVSTVEVGGNETLGEFLVAGSGWTLYIFTPDQPGVSNCNGGCAAAWPPLTVADGETPTGGAGVNGELTLITRDDGSQQVALDGAALYFYRDDSAPGESNGQDVGDKWFVIDGDGAIVQTPAAGPEVGSGGNSGLISGGDDTSPLVVALMLIGTIGLVFVGRSTFPTR